MQLTNVETAATTFETIQPATMPSIGVAKPVYYCNLDGLNSSVICGGGRITNRLNLDLVERYTMTLQTDVTDVTSSNF